MEAKWLFTVFYFEYFVGIISSYKRKIWLDRIKYSVQRQYGTKLWLPHYTYIKLNNFGMVEYIQCKLNDLNTNKL